MPLISYVKTAMSKQLLISKSYDNSNRYTPYRGNLIHRTSGYSMLTSVGTDSGKVHNTKVVDNFVIFPAVLTHPHQTNGSGVVISES
jgi:hypothetical protein